MCYCNYLNDREDYCGSGRCNAAAYAKGYPIKIDINKHTVSIIEKAREVVNQYNKAMQDGNGGYSIDYFEDLWTAMSNLEDSLK